MPERNMRTRPKLLLVTAAVAVSIGLLAATNALAATTDVAQSADANGEPQLGRVSAPPAPAGCPADQLAERARQVSLLDAEKANEQGVIATIFDGSAPDKLGAIRDRAGIILGRIATIDSRCGGTPAAAPGTPAAPAAPVAANRVLTPVRIVCADVDFTGVDPARATRATSELARNLDELNGRLTREFPRFAARVAREANPDAPRNEFATLARQQANTLQARRVAILDRAAAGLAARFARTCTVVNANGTAAPTAAPTPPAPATPSAPAVPAAAVAANRVLTPVKIVCADVDFTGVDPAQATRATSELARNLDELNGRLTREFPRFAARVAREANPDAPRNEFATLARQQANTLQARRVAILDRAAAGLAARFARTCTVVNA